jgi:undecaprenyl-diphosphatase
LLLASTLFVLLAGTVLDGSLTRGLDLTVLNALQSLRSPWGDHLMTSFSVPGDLPAFLIIACGLTGILWLRGQKRASYYLLAAAIFGLLAPLLMKYSLRVPRPPTAGESLGAWSFPSAHVMRTLTLYGFFSIMVARTLISEWRWLPYSLAALVVAAVALSRLYLGVHWLTDILASLTLGTAWVAFLGIAYHRHVAPISQRGLLLGGLATLIIPASLYALSAHEARFNSYQAEIETTTFPLKGWQQAVDERLPDYRNDIRGRNDQPLNIVIAGQPDCIARHLAPLGWQKAEMLDWHNLLRLLSSRTPIAQLPVSPQVHAGKHEVFALGRILDEDSRLLLRLWPTQIQLEAHKIPIFVGVVSRQLRSETLKLITIPRTDMAFQQAQSALFHEVEPLNFSLSVLRDRLFFDLSLEDSCRDL